jgi:hypothetical protein
MLLVGVFAKTFIKRLCMYVLNLSKYGWGHMFGDFSRTTSGHPGRRRSATACCQV